MHSKVNKNMINYSMDYYMHEPDSLKDEKLKIIARKALQS